MIWFKAVFNLNCQWHYDRRAKVIEQKELKGNVHAYYIYSSFPLIHQICSLLFGAVANDQEGSIQSNLPSLVCASDTEDEAGDNGSREEEFVGVR